MKIAIVDKQPGHTDYVAYFKLGEYADNVNLYHLSSVKISKVLRKDVDIEIDEEAYDFIILVGAEACKFIAGVTTKLAGTLVKDKYIPIVNPAVLNFKPAMVGDFDRAVERLQSIIEGTSPATTVIAEYTEDSKQALEWLTEALEHEIVALDTETSALYPRDGYLLGVSLTWKDNTGVYICADVLEEEHCALLQDILDKCSCVFHNAKFDIKWLALHLGLIIGRGELHDTMLLHYLLDETQGSHGLKALALKYTSYGDYDAALEDFKNSYCKLHKIKKEDFSYSFIPIEVLGTYAAIDTAVTYSLFNLFFPIVSKSKMLFPVYKDIMVPGMFFLNDVEENGVPFCRERLKLGQETMDKEIGELKSQIYDYPEVAALEASTGSVFNPNSVQQLRALLFTHCGLTPTGRKTGTGADSTDATTLQELSPQHPLPKLILDIRQKTKIKSTYLDKIISGVDLDDRLRTGFNLTSTTSGRLSSSGKLNMQQLPRDNKLVKGCIKAPEGYKIVSQDLQTGEMYYAAILSGDKKLQGVFQQGSDFHSTIARDVFNLPCEIPEVKTLYPSFRQASKAISFGILYGSGPAKVADVISEFNRENGVNEVFTVTDAKEAIAAYFKEYKKLKKWLDDQGELIRTQGFIYSALGRKRRLKDVFSTDKGLASSQVRSGINFLVQSVSSDINLLAGIETNRRIKEDGKEEQAQIFALVHDSIVAIVADEYVEEFCKILQDATQRDLGVSIPGTPIGVDCEIGQDYSFDGFEKQFPALYTLAA